MVDSDSLGAVKAIFTRYSLLIRGFWRWRTTGMGREKDYWGGHFLIDITKANFQWGSFVLTPNTFSTKAFKSGSKRPRETAAHCDSLFTMKAKEEVQISLISAHWLLTSDPWLQTWDFQLWNNNFRLDTQFSDFRLMTNNFRLQALVSYFRIETSDSVWCPKSE